MNQEIYEEAILNADTAFKNNNYEVALDWYRKAIEENPSDMYALSRAGTVCVPLEKFDDALTYFNKAIEIDPENGDARFNLGNAYYFKEDYNKALECYAEAEIKGCSELAAPRLYYQMALLCSLRQDVDAALLNFKKYEEADTTRRGSLDPAVISEKLKLYMMAEDYDMAAKCAVEWISVAPNQLQGYMVYFGILMAKQQYDEAEKMLGDAEKYAAISDSERVNVNIEKAALYIVKATINPDQADDYNRKAYTILNELRKTAPEDKRFDIELTFAEACVKMQKYEEAIKAAEALIPSDEMPKPIDFNQPDFFVDIDESEMDAMAEEDMEIIDEKITTGELSEDIGEYAEVSYDDDGNPVREYPEGSFDDLADDAVTDEDIPEESAPKGAAGEIPAELLDRVYFLLLSCYATVKDFEKAYQFGSFLKHSSNDYYAYFARYTAAFALKQISETVSTVTKDDVDKRYAEDIAFYRSKMLQDSDNNFALVFRARMYAETGKFVKAEEMASLLGAEEKKSLMGYIDQCRKTYKAM